MKLTIACWNIAAARKIKSLEKFDYEKDDIPFFQIS